LRGLYFLGLPIALILLTLIPPTIGREIRSDPVSGRTRVIYMGKVGWEGPFPVMDLDPMIFGTAVYTSTILYDMEIIRKSLRAYMPRTYSKLLDHDVIVMADAYKDVFRPEHFTWIKRGVIEGGMGLVMIGGAESFTGKKGTYPSWRPTVVADVLPCLMTDEGVPLGGGKIKIIDWDDEFIESLPFQTLGLMGQWPESNQIIPRTEAHLLANLVRGLGREDACLMWWDIGEGRTMAQSVSWQLAGGVNFMRWTYYGDYAINMMLFLAGYKLPDDLEIVYLLRRRMREAEEGIGILINMADLIEKFGGNSIPAGPMIAEIQDKKKNATLLYTRADMEGAIAAFSEVIISIGDTMDELIEMRNCSAFWIFLTEWCIVSGTLMITATLLWMIMVKRRLYHEVEVTRSRMDA
jgi:uncharacterized membrane protein